MDFHKTAEAIASRYFVVGIETERWEHLVDDIVTALKAEQERAAEAATQRGRELGELAIGSDIATMIREPDLSP